MDRIVETPITTNISEYRITIGDQRYKYFDSPGKGRTNLKDVICYPVK
jgi:hypothetical protein